MTTTVSTQTRIRQLEAILNTVPDAILTVDDAGMILSTNLAAEVLFCCELADLLGQHIDFYIPSFSLLNSTLAHPSDTDNKREPRISGLVYECAGRTKNGAKFDIEISVGKISSAEAEEIHHVIVIRDITDRKVMRDNLESQMEKLEQSNENLASFAQIVSHDLKEPLRKILHHSKTFFNENVGVKQLLSSGKNIFATAERMDKLIKDLLRYIVADKDQWFANADLNLVLKDVTQDLAVLIQEKNANIYYGQLPIIQSNPVQLRQLFQNLISNALKFSKENLKPVINIASKIYNEGEDKSICIITIADNGIGFDAKYADKIFSPFMQLNSTQKYAGSGIGLAICKKIVSNHSGIIKAHSKPGIGSEFTVILPLNKQAICTVKNVA